MPSPHRIDEATMAAFFNDYIVEGASATTADGSQRKRLVQRARRAERGGITYIVQRRYIAEVGLGGGWTDVYSGSDLDEAVRFYNSLS